MRNPTLKREILSEILHVLALFLIIVYGLMVFDITNRVADETLLRNWEYNINCPIPAGFDRAMVR